MAGLSRLYRYIFVYNPTSNTISHFRIFNCDSVGVADFILDCFGSMDKSKEILLGKSLAGNFYQLSIVVYGSQLYYKEDNKSVERFIHTGRVCCAVSKHISDNKLWDDLE